VKILIGQPTFEEGISRLKKDVETNKNLDIILYPEGYLESYESLEKACLLAKKYHVNIITSFRKNKQDIAVSINRKGNIIYFREKTSPDISISLNSPLIYHVEDKVIGYLLCMEIIKGTRDFPKEEKVDMIFHPIGVGMYSDEQFNEWVTEAKKIAIKNKTFILGCSHSNGSYKNCGFSIPIAYCFDKDGKEIFLLKNQIQAKIININL
jgi:hypothetical protein